MSEVVISGLPNTEDDRRSGVAAENDLI